ncbi:hypothetical protein LXA43DRAFT_250829 [Ganoderma leucocontextum]|nr:hypothetical protein LXA43DRAFT_250829 [Ganoderma leucocontextum]
MMSPLANCVQWLPFSAGVMWRIVRYIAFPVTVAGTYRTLRPYPVLTSPSAYSYLLLPSSNAASTSITDHITTATTTTTTTTTTTICSMLSKLFLSRSSRRSSGSDRRTSIDSLESGESYIISLPSMYPPPTLPGEPTSNASSSQPAEMLDDDNFAWGRPSRKHTKSKRARSSSTSRARAH